MILPSLACEFQGEQPVLLLILAFSQEVGLQQPIMEEINE